ncbi:hypothetical protein FB45DRAFT_1065587 [Roridomyces roridus]|uniref:F-box domain-containing protein n=1 Tax=Roridomyces roridus TaxID=1738132 RepID=A0AAD7B7J7_9AGAR|nr:hypothetical protein FB45DRAFT_1065587 [Roridomyces roridus]
MDPTSASLSLKLPRIPNEIFVEILQNVGNADLTTVCRVSKPFFGIGVHLLYRAVDLEAVKPECIPLFCQTVASTPHLARMVRSLRGWKHGLYSAGSMSNPGVDVTTLALESFAHLTQLESFSINMDLLHPEYHRKFLQWRFPHLRSVSLALTALVPVDALILSFLRNHPGVERLGSTLRYTLSRTDSTPIALPRLQTFRGPPGLLPLLSAGDGNLAEAKLLWPPNLDVNAIVLALRDLAREDAPFVLSNDYCDESFTEILDAVGREMPNTRTLQMRFQDLKMLEKKIPLTRRYLSQFSQLAWLSIGTMFSSENGEDAQRLAREFGECCPTLEGCCFKDLGAQFLMSTWPTPNPAVRAEVDELCQTLTHKLVPIAAYDIDGLIIPPGDYVHKLPSAVVEARFTVSHVKIGGTHYYSADIAQLDVLVEPSVLPARTSPVKRGADISLVSPTHKKARKD